MGTPESKTEEKDSLNQTPTETRPKSEREKSEESMEMLKFFDCLSESACKEVLKNLCRTRERDTKPKNLSLDKTRSAMEYQSNTEKARLYDDFMGTQRKKALAKRYVGKIPSHQLQTGLQITLVSCKEKDLGEVTSFFASRIAAMMLSLARRQGTRLSNPSRRRSLLGI